jgi:CHASE2 domain-containing sensor protein
MLKPSGLSSYPILRRILEFFLVPLIRLVDTLCPRCRPWWDKQSRFVQQLIINLTIGLPIAMIVMLLHNSRWVTEFEDMNVDWLMSFYRGSAPNLEKSTYPYVFINIDEETHQAWGEPLLTPRDKLQQLLHFAVKGQAAVIVVDIDLSYPRDAKQQKLDALTEADLKLRGYLENYEEKYCKASCPHIILVRSFRKQLMNDNGVYYPEQRSTFLDKIVKNSPHLHWASVHFDREQDRVLRRWQLWQGACTQETPAKVVVPSIPLLTLALLSDPKNGVSKLNKQLQNFLPSDCSQSQQRSWSEFNQAQNIKISDWEFHPQPSRLNRRIFYTIPWQLNEGEKRPQVDSRRFLFDQLSAKNVLKNLDADSSPLLQKSITIIGGSYLESRDFYATPIGWMPGALVLVNAIHSILQYGELNAPPFWILLFIIAIVIMLMSLLLTHFDSFWGMTFSGLGIILIILPISFLFFEYGVWLNFAIPLLIIQWRQMAADYKEAINKCSLPPVK